MLSAAALTSATALSVKSNEAVQELNGIGKMVWGDRWPTASRTRRKAVLNAAHAAMDRGRELGVLSAL